MKQLFVCVLLLSSLFCEAQIHPQVGDKFIYNVTANGESYDFTIVLKSLKPEISFAWQMSNEKESYGKLTIGAAAFANSNKLYNYFSTGDIRLSDMTSVVLSKAVMSKLRKTEEADLYDGKTKYHFTSNGRDGMSYTLNNEDVQSDALYLAAPGKNYLTVLDDPNFPLIMSMEIGWSIRLEMYVPVSQYATDFSELIGKEQSHDACIVALSKLYRSSSSAKVEDLGNISADKISVHKTRSSFIESLVVEMHNDSITHIIYYPTELTHGEGKFYGANYRIKQISNFSLNRVEQRRQLAAKYGKAVTAGLVDSYQVSPGVTMDVYYHIPKKGPDGQVFNTGSDQKALTKQKVAFVSFQ